MRGKTGGAGALGGLFAIDSSGGVIAPRAIVRLLGQSRG